MKFTVVLGNIKNQTLELPYTLNSSASAKVWWKSLNLAATQSHISGAVFYNFEKNQTEKLCIELENCILELQKMVPALSNAALDRSDLQNSLNRLHANFAHSHLIEDSLIDDAKPVWSRFNLLIHQIESTLVAKNTNAEIDLCRIEFFWEKNFKTEIPMPCYSEYSLGAAFGSIQINYCQIGRQLYEIFAAQDAEVSHEHIKPARFFSANSTLWFGPDIPESYQIEYTEKIRKWYQLHQAKFEQAGVFWDRDDKALGAVTVASLNRKFDTADDKKLFQQELSRFDRVLSVIC